jgi:hypothetical protein
MNDLIWYFSGHASGLLLGYLLWAPETEFKKGFKDGLELGPIRRFFAKVTK